MSEPLKSNALNPLDRARRKAYRRLIPLLFLCYMIAYVDRTNVGLAKLTMSKDLPAFTETVVGFGAGIFFVGYFLLEIPGTLLVERWSARKWISRIMVSWGLVAALTALVKTPVQFYLVRFLLGLAEAGFFPGVIVYLTHWFPSRDRTRALSWFLIATPIAQMFSPKISNLMLSFGTDDFVEILGTRFVSYHHPEFLGLKGWQCVYIFWGIPAVVLGLFVLLYLTDRPKNARWLRPEEREALESELARENLERKGKGGHMTLWEAFKNPKVLFLAAAYFFIVMGNYGVEFFMPSIFNEWYSLNLNSLTWYVMIPPIGSLIGQLFVGWNSDRTKERLLHAAMPIFMGSAALASTLFIKDQIWVTVALFTFVVAGTKAYLPAFWALPSLFLTEAAAAGSIGLINAVGNLGGQVGPFVVGYVHDQTKSYNGGILFLSVSIAISATILITLGLGKRSDSLTHPLADPLAEAIPQPSD